MYGEVLYKVLKRDTIGKHCGETQEFGNVRTQ